MTKIIFKKDKTGAVFTGLLFSWRFFMLVYTYENGLSWYWKQVKPAQS